MKNVLLAIALLLSITVNAQINVTVSGMVFNSSAKKVKLVREDDGKTNEYLSGSFDKEGNFSMQGEVPQQDYYTLLFGDDKIHLILRENSDIKVYGDGANLKSFVNIIGSDESSNYHKFKMEVAAWMAASDSATALIKADPSKQAEVNQSMASKYSQFQSVVKTFVARNPNSPALIAAIPVIDLNSDFPTYEAIVNQLNGIFGQSEDVKAVKAQYDQVKEQILANDPLAPGKMAPDFEELKPDGSSMKLSDLKGQIVLLDFWASWCGPCRRENPNVVAMYNKYKNEGFTVMSVSLDKDRTKWLEAIEKDNLTWPHHVSDLKYWSSKAAKIYGVSGIPFTVLIDREGRIVKTKLRGPQLEEEVSRLLKN